MRYFGYSATGKWAFQGQHHFIPLALDRFTWVFAPQTCRFDMAHSRQTIILLRYSMLMGIFSRRRGTCILLHILPFLYRLISQSWRYSLQKHSKNM